MAADIIMPQLGNEIDEAEIDEWLVKPGDTVGVGEPMVAITTPKLTMEIEAPASGRVAEICHQPGDIVAVGTVLGVIAEDVDG